MKPLNSAILDGNSPRIRHRCKDKLLNNLGILPKLSLGLFSLTLISALLENHWLENDLIFLVLNYFNFLIF